MSVEVDVPANLLASHRETAYFWGRVVGDGDVTDGCLTVRTNDETAADRLAAIAGGEQVDHRIVEREYAHDTAITRTEDEYTVQVFGDVANRAAAAFGLPLDGDPGGYRLDAFDGYERQFLRGLLEGCGTVCFKSSSQTVGLSFVHDDRRLLERLQRLIENAPVDYRETDESASMTGDISETSSGGYWFGVDDDAAPSVGPWLYEGCEVSGLFAPSRKRKLQRSLERAGGR